MAQILLKALLNCAKQDSFCMHKYLYYLLLKRGGEICTLFMEFYVGTIQSETRK